MKFLVCIAVYIVLILTTILYMSSAGAEQRDEPAISNYQGSESGTSVIVLEWPDGKVEKFIYKNKDSGSTNYLTWFNERYDAYEARKAAKK